MIIKSHIRGGYLSAADYLKDQGENETTRLVEISDPSTKNLDEAFHNMWVVASNTRCTKPLHHISINPIKDERLTDQQVLAIVQRCEEKYGYKLFHHQRVIVEHIKDGRQHFHVMWNRVSLVTGRPVWPGHHWNKSKQVCREMEKELGLKRPALRRASFNGARKTSGRSRKVKSYLRHTSYTAAQKTTNNSLPDKSAYINPATKSYASELAPLRPTHNTKGWPLAAIIDWETWGHRNPKRFFALWPELGR